MKEEKDMQMKVLIAEDDPVSRRLLEVFLTKWGYQIVVASSGTEALELLAQIDAPRLALLDWMMPGLEGVQVCRKIRERKDRPYVYLLLLSARTQKEDLLLGLESGADDYLTKPFNAPELRARLNVGQRILQLQDSLMVAGAELLFRATHDPLTGISNRGMVLDALHKEHSRQVRQGGSFGIVLLDVDHFKSVNDTHGHLCGDRVLQEVVRRVASTVRPYDTVGRYGGEEFLIVVPSSDSANIFGLSERIRRAIESKPIATDSGEISVTVSLGLAVSSAIVPLDPEVMLDTADKALYRGKEAGRNRSEMGISQTATLSAVSEISPVKTGSQ
ncbi:MAG TPA: diguanylate cyclase [Candidatus Acidoferrales bacterium]|nr:diguanylate cyclase [Candidatus Acidoferrales bacterium]